MKYKNFLIGTSICVLIAIPAWIMGKHFTIIGASIFGILLGLILNHIFNLKNFEKGISFTSKKMLKWSIILLGFNMNFQSIIKAGKNSFTIIIITISLTLLFGYLLSKILKLDKNTSILIAVGTSICGGSAIAATAPVIQAKDNEIANAMSIIFLFNIFAVFIFPPIGMSLGMSDELFGMWSGNAINDTSSVVAAGLTWSGYVGTNTALKAATIVKLTRTLMIIPITTFLAIYTTKKNIGIKKNYSIIKIFPWFIIGFLIAAIINTSFDLPFDLSVKLAAIGKFMIVIAMVAIGMNINIKEMKESGIKPILLGLLCWIVLSISSLVIQNVFL